MTRDDASLLSRDDEEFAGARELLAQRAKGAPLAEHEIEILDAWRSGLTVAQIEAETLLSGAVYRLFVEGSPASGEDRDLIARWRAYRAQHTAEIVSRAAQLTGESRAALRAPDASRDFELYWDPELYNQLSSAYQLRLRKHYGMRTRGRNANPPALEGEGVASGESSPDSGFLNVLVNNPAADTTVQDTQSETSLVLGTGANVLVSFNDSGSENTGSHFTGIARSTDGGTTFTDQGELPASASGDAGDPVYARNNTNGHIVLSTLGFTSGAVLQCFKSTDDGATFSAPANCAAGGGSHDKEWLACDNAGGAGQGNFYNFWRDFAGGGGMTFTRSTDSGATWGSRQVLDAAAGQGAWVVTGSDHTVYAFWLKSGPNRIVMRKSTDQGVTFGAQTPVTTLRTTGTNGDFGFSGGFRSNAFPQVVAHPTDATQLYMAWADNAVSGSDKANVYLSRTTNGGATWATPAQVNLDSTAHDNWQPVIAINPAGTRLFVSWYDRRLNGTAIDVYGRNFLIDGTNLHGGLDYRITDVSFPVVVGQDPVIVSTYMGDYDQAVGDAAGFYRTWGDNRLSTALHTNQPDVRYAEVPPDAYFGANPRAGASTLQLSGCAAGNGVIDPGETVDIDLTVTNEGTNDVVNLVGTLQSTGGVLNPSAPRTYGLLQPGDSATKRYSFTAGGSCGSQILLSLQLQDGATPYGVVTFGPLLTGLEGAAVPFSNPAAITINDNTAGTPYPSNITVAGMTPYARVAVDLFDLSHTFPDDIDIVLVAPTLAKAYVMSDNGSGTDIVNVDLTFSDTAAASLTTATIVSGIYKPSNLDTSTDILPAPAPAGPYDGTFANLGTLGVAANGTWSLYVRDDVGTDTGSIAGGWRLSFISLSCSAACSSGLFSDGFESVNVCRWSSATGYGPGC